VNKQTQTTYPLNNPKNNPKVLSTDPRPVQVIVLFNDLPTSIIINNVRIKIKKPNPTLLIKSDSTYSLTQGRSLGTNNIVTIAEKTHFIKDIKLNEKPLAKH
jgi:hypothetical protein